LGRSEKIEMEGERGEGRVSGVPLQDKFLAMPMLIAASIDVFLQELSRM